MIEEEANVFKIYISHLKQENDEHELFLSKLYASTEFNWENCALTSENDIEDIMEHMKPADSVVILSGLIGKDKDFLTLQIDAAGKLKKPIVVVRPYGMENIPNNLEQIAATVVGWNTPCIVDAILESMGVEEDFV